MTEEQKQQWAYLMNSAVAEAEIERRVSEAMDTILGEALASHYTDKEFVRKQLESIAQEMGVDWEPQV